MLSDVCGKSLLNYFCDRLCLVQHLYTKEPSLIPSTSTTYRVLYFSPISEGCLFFLFFYSFYYCEIVKFV